MELKKYIFEWYVGDGYTFGYTAVIPFECEDVEQFILECIDKLDKSEYGEEILGIYVDKIESELLERSIFTLEDWFNLKKVTI